MCLVLDVVLAGSPDKCSNPGGKYNLQTGTRSDYDRGTGAVQAGAGRYRQVQLQVRAVPYV